MKRRFVLLALPLLASVLSACSPAGQAKAEAASGSSAAAPANVTLLNVSYDLSRSFYEHLNPEFIRFYEQQHPDSKLVIQQSHGGASKQALAVANGLRADVVTLNQESDLAMLADKKLISANWQAEFPNQAVPYHSIMVLLVRKDNPKNIRDWSDLSRNDIDIIIANPKTSGTARYGFLAMYDAALQDGGGDEALAEQTLRRFVSRIKVMDSGARGASNSFVQRKIGDVMVTTENEAALTAQTFGSDGYQVVYPSSSVAIDNPVAIVRSVTEAKGTTAIAHDYLNFLWSDVAQTRAAEEYLRPSNPDILAKYSSRFPKVNTWRVTDKLGSWADVTQKYFADGGLLDRVSVPAH